MRIGLHVGQLCQPVPGGIGRYVECLIDALPTAGVDAVPFAAGAPPHPPAGFVDLRWPTGGWRYEAWHRLRRPTVSLPGAPVDVVHAPSLAVPPAEPLVVTVHDLAFRALPDAFTKRGRRFHERGLALARAEAAAVITPSEFTRRSLIDDGFTAERIHVAPHGADLVDVEPPDPDADAEIRERAGIDGPFVLAVGTVEPRKGFEVAAAAVQSLAGATPVDLVIAGPDGWGELSGLDAPRVRRLGAVSRDRLDALYRSASATLVPSTYEGFGFPALEAMARGCPVIASDTTSLPEVVGDAGILVEPGDVQGWRAAVEVLLGDPERRGERAAAGRRRAAEFTWERSAAAHLRAYQAARAAHS